MKSSCKIDVRFREEDEPGRKVKEEPWWYAFGTTMRVERRRCSGKIRRVREAL